MALDEFRKSVNAILYERVSSPLWGTLVFSWLAWNWRVLILLFFTDAEDIKMSKLSYIEANLMDPWYTIGFPLISTAILLTAFPFISEGAYKLHMYFRKRKDGIKESYESQTRLTVEQSVALRMELKKMQEQMNQLSEEKEAELKIVEEERNEAIEKATEVQTKTRDEIANRSSKEDEEENEKIEQSLKKRDFLKSFDEIIEAVDNKKEINTASDEIAFLQIIGLLKRMDDRGYYYYSFTKKGEDFRDYYINKFLL